MRKRSSTEKENGVRIYKDSERYTDRCSGNDICARDSKNIVAKDEIVLNRDSDDLNNDNDHHTRSPHCKTSSLAAGDDYIGQLTTTQQVLETLDQQISSLNALKHTSTKGITQHQHHTEPPDDCIIGRKFASPVAIDFLAITANESPSPEARLEALDHYIKHSINVVGSGDCGCHFEHASGGAVLNKLNERLSSPSGLESCRSPRSQSSGNSPSQYSWRDSVQSALGSICSLESDPQGNDDNYRFSNHNQQQRQEHLFIDETFERNPQRNTTTTTATQSTETITRLRATGSRIQGLCGRNLQTNNSNTSDSLHILSHNEPTNVTLRPRDQSSSCFGHQLCSGEETKSCIDLIRAVGEDLSELCEESLDEEEVLTDTSNVLESLVDFDATRSEESPSTIRPRLTSSPYIRGINVQENLKEGSEVKRALVQERSNYFRTQHLLEQSLNNNNNTNCTLASYEDLCLNGETKVCLEILECKADLDNCCSTNCRGLHHSSAASDTQQQSLIYAPLSAGNPTIVLANSQSFCYDEEEPQIRKKIRLDSRYHYTLAEAAQDFTHHPKSPLSGQYHSNKSRKVQKMGSENREFINKNRNKRRDFFNTQPTKIETNTRLKQPDNNQKGLAGLCKDLSSNGGLQAENLSSSACSLSPTKEKKQSDSMRAVKDLAKMSAPSLSSLQYLPSQVDSFEALKRIKESKQSGAQEDENPKVASSKLLSGNNDKMNPVRVITESRENVKHSESCLLDRLCLCNCMARSHYDLSRQEELSKSSVERADKKQEKLKRPKSCTSDTSTDEAVSTRSASASFERSLSPEQSRRVAAKIGKENEKQSPSFLNILKSPSAHISRYSRELRRSQQRLEVCREDSLGSSVEFVATASSRNSEQTTENESGSSSFLRARSSSFATGANRASFLSSCSSKEDGNCLRSTETATRPQSAEPQHESAAVKATVSAGLKEQQHHQKVSTYKKFLSPTKLFSSSSNRCLNEDCQTPLSEISDETSKQPVSSSTSPTNQQQSSSSFFFRSLNRLSNRKSSNNSTKSRSVGSKRKRSGDSNLERKQADTSTCVSPTISISTASQQVDSLAGSINSLDEEVDLSQLPGFSASAPREKSRSFLAPEVMLRRAGGENYEPDNRSHISASSAYEMTRTNNYRYQAGGRQPNIYRDAYSPVRYGSEFSDYTSDASDRAYSVPVSPLVRRRTPGRARTQRLAQSPVPFRSPATESTKIEDGLKVCSTEHFEKHIGNIKDNQEEAQKNLFKTWINHFCPNLIQRDLVEELRDGIKLIGLLAHLTRDKQLFSQYDKLHRDKRSYINRIVTTPSSKLRQLSTVSIAIDYLRNNRGMKLINLNPMDIVSGKPNVILGLCWNIILNFQLEQNYLNSQLCSQSSNGSIDDRTSRLSKGSNEELSAKPTKKYGTSAGVSPAEEYTCSDLVTARKRLLDFINKRFDLKLTNLTSNLLDGDVMMVIIRNLLPHDSDVETKNWKSLSNDEKLDHCFELAQDRLNVPRLFTATDLRQQAISDNNFKPLLVYLTMLLSTDPKCRVPEQTNEIPRAEDDIALDEKLQNSETAAIAEDLAAEVQIEDYLTGLERDSRFEVDKLQSTLSKIKELDNLIESRSELQTVSGSDRNLIERYQALKDRACQVEVLISWINQADVLFETSQKSAVDLTNSIKEYKEFFSPGNVPEIKTTLCPTLERQYRECLGTARQRVLVMEQTLKNWYDYEKARKELRDWLSTAEQKLTDALGPIDTSDSEAKEAELHTDRLKDVIDYFDLETIDVILNDTSPVSMDLSDKSRQMRMSCESLSPRKFSAEDSHSISGGSLLSLGSTSSKISTLQSSSKAMHNRLLDNFELKCRLLATMLDAEQKESLLIGVKELKSRLKYITEHRVPQVVGQLRFNINRLEPNLRSESDTIKSGEESVTVGDSTVDEVQEVPREIKGNSERSPPVEIKPKNKSRKQNSQPPKNQKSRNNSKGKPASKRNHKIVIKKDFKDHDDISDDDISITRRIWMKVVRAYRASFSLNIVLLIFLAGLCVVPLIHRDACCELVNNRIYPDNFGVHKKPT